MKKRPIDLFRESSDSFKIESSGDDTPIQEMCELNGALALITKNAVYEVMFADKIDPKRENPALPHNVQKRVLEIGANSSLVGKTLLTANALFKEKFLPAFVDSHKAMSLVFEALKDLVDMSITSAEFSEAEKREIQIMQNQPKNNRSFVLPSISNLAQRAKSFAQKANHVEDAIIKLILLFYSDISARHFSTAVDKLKVKYGHSDNFIKFLDKVLPFMKMVRNLRDCLEHKNPKNNADVSDFTINQDGSITPPTITMNFRGTQFKQVVLSSFMANVMSEMKSIIQDIMFFLCSKHVQSFGGFPIQVGVIPEGQRRNQFVQYGYVINLTGQWMPVG